jgi:hypothetical protein
MKKNELMFSYFGIKPTDSKRVLKEAYEARVKEIKSKMITCLPDQRNQYKNHLNMIEGIYFSLEKSLAGKEPEEVFSKKEQEMFDMVRDFYDVLEENDYVASPNYRGDEDQFRNSIDNELGISKKKVGAVIIGHSAIDMIQYLFTNELTITLFCWGGADENEEYQQVLDALVDLVQQLGFKAKLKEGDRHHIYLKVDIDPFTDMPS